MSKLNKEELVYWLSQAKWYHPESDREERKSDQAYDQIKELIQKPESKISPRLEYDDDGNIIEMGISGGTEQKPKVTDKWIDNFIEEKAKEPINKSFKDYETEIQAILFVDPISKSSYQEINKATDTLVDQVWDIIRSLIEEIQGVA